MSNAPRVFGEFFAGIGLARIGLERAGWKCVFANDVDLKKKRMYEDNFGPAKYYSTEDVHLLADRPAEIPDMTLAHASFPCTDLSIAGARGGIHVGQSSAFWGFHRLLENLGPRRPSLVLLENVVGFLTSHGGRDFLEAMRAMNDLGYAVDPFILDAAHFVPQSRPRLFVVCSQGVAEETDDGASVLRPPNLMRVIASDTSIRWSLADLPEPPEYGSRQLSEILEEVPPDSPDWWSRKRAEYLLSQMSERHRLIADGMIAGEEISFGTVFRRMRNGRSTAELRTDGLAGCLRTLKGGSARQILFQAGGGEYRVRLLSPRECLRLMGVGRYKLSVAKSVALYAIGDGVCADVIKWIARLHPAIASYDANSSSQHSAAAEAEPIKV